MGQEGDGRSVWSYLYGGMEIYSPWYCPQMCQRVCCSFKLCTGPITLIWGRSAWTILPPRETFLDSQSMLVCSFARTSPGARKTESEPSALHDGVPLRPPIPHSFVYKPHACACCCSVFHKCFPRRKEITQQCIATLPMFTLYGDCSQSGVRNEINLSTFTKEYQSRKAIFSSRKWCEASRKLLMPHKTLCSHLHWQLVCSGKEYKFGTLWR